MSGVKEVAKKVVQNCRLMVGIHDYEYHFAHMRERCREALYLYCLEARCPC
ncbi:MAG TPA: hypothetical protein VLC92_01650 [Rhodocyclaceae bacterium]|nr:hypothetical protein [Rhodocyclaceae bacterium]